MNLRKRSSCFKYYNPSAGNANGTTKFSQKKESHKKKTKKASDFIDDFEGTKNEKGFWEVERIEMVRKVDIQNGSKRKVTYEFYVKWLGFSCRHNTWQKVDDFKSTESLRGLLEDFKSSTNSEKAAQKTLAFLALSSLPFIQENAKKSSKELNQHPETAASLCFSDSMGSSSESQEPGSFQNTASPGLELFSGEIQRSPSHFEENSAEQMGTLENMGDEEIRNILRNQDEVRIGRIFAEKSKLVCQVRKGYHTAPETLAIKDLAIKYPNLLEEFERRLAGIIFHVNASGEQNIILNE